jgi:hypothetical protein
LRVATGATSRVRNIDLAITQGELTLDCKRPLKGLLSANKRLDAVYVLNESSGQQRSYERDAWAADRWRAGLK